jgi:UDP-2,3-diacylglucosamine hydrolase
VPQTLFLSDVHLSPDDPATPTLFLELLGGRARDAEALYVLGDLFDVWVGDDDPSPFNARVVAALRALVDQGTAVFLMRGNRDFLIGVDFATRSGCRLLEDTMVIELDGTATLLMHGDTLCTDDHEYQRFRATSRTPEWRSAMLAKPLEERLGLAAAYRRTSREHKERLAENIMDVNRRTVAASMRQFGVRRLIHGHTHRPAVHHFDLDGEAATRHVLAQWEGVGSILCWDEAGPRVEVLS